MFYQTVEKYYCGTLNRIAINKIIGFSMCAIWSYFLSLALLHMQVVWLQIKRFTVLFGRRCKTKSTLGQYFFSEWLLVTLNVLVWLPQSNAWRSWFKAKAICQQLAPDQHKRQETSPREWNGVLCVHLLPVDILVQLYDLALSAGQFYWQHFTGPVCKRRPHTEQRGRGLNGSFYISG